jgi:hypothetical protein
MEEIDELTYREIPIAGYEGKYVMNGFEVKSVGRWAEGVKSGKIIKRFWPEQIMSMFMWGGYPAVRLCKNSKQKFFTFHRLKAALYIPNPENKPQVNHKNGIKTDFSLSNLEWCTAKENTRHAFDNGLNFVPNGADHPNAKGVTQLTKNGIFIASYCTAREANFITGVDYKLISAVLQEKQKTAGGFIWKFT